MVVLSGESMPKRSWTLLLAMIFLYSCSSVRSGLYVKLEDRDNLASLSKEYDVPKWELKELNKGKQFSRGNWIFVPQKKGILKTARYGRGPSSVELLGKTGEFIWPVPSSKKITSSFGKRWGKNHNGIDIPGRRGSHILSTGDGVVVYSGRDYSGFGNMIIIAHKFGVFSIYAHNQKNYISKGEKVHKSQVIGTLGSSGRSTGPHLHFEFRRDGKPIDPLIVFAKNKSRMFARK